MMKVAEEGKGREETFLRMTLKAKSTRFKNWWNF